MDLRRLSPARTALRLILTACLAAFMAPSRGSSAVEQWGVAEIILQGPSEGNPFTDVELSAVFLKEGRTFKASGFYDGAGVYRIRFMPDRPGVWEYTTHSNRRELDGKTGRIEVMPPSPGNHGPVRVRNEFHFAYEDGTRYVPIGTTCYAWTHQMESLEAQTLETLAHSPFNKIRMCVFPKSYTYNRAEPPRYPFEGTPPKTWDFSRFNPDFFRHLEDRIERLRDLGIEADVILLHPYDEGRWGFDRMPAEADDRYLRYVVARLSAYRNVWWSLANEWDFMKEKRESDWDRMLMVVRDADPYNHLRSIHNGTLIYNHSQPWITHASIQNGSATKDYGRAVLYRDVYRKPIVFDEVCYEGNLPDRWGHLSAQEMVDAFWQGTIAGTYVGHGETYLSPDEVIWWSKGGVLHGQSPPRIAFLRKIIEEGPSHGLEPIDKWQGSPSVGKRGEYYLFYFGREAPKVWPFKIPRTRMNEPMTFQVDVIDAWDMTVTPVEGTFTVTPSDRYTFACPERPSIPLPGKPYTAVRLRRVSDAKTP
ncbi:DUF5060 domain-containing protein [Paludisphaera rhizosphaerae]|uniref:DUF5060 domain-containing protein n=1 Tax=Paludisphaera rhizosphaerae TaxID=2711216 RepID=UPI00197D2BCB|nr:DUF5060 domain-containing protein [Paludisphaera rhizosphaerae]